MDNSMKVEMYPMSHGIEKRSDGEKRDYNEYGALSQKFRDIFDQELKMQKEKSRKE